MPDTMDAARVALIDALNRALQRKANELFQYALESTPYVPRGDEHILDAFRRLIPIDRDNAKSLAEAVRMLHGIPSPGCWDLGVADMNYLEVRFLARHIIGELRETERLLQDSLKLAADFPKAKAVMHGVLDDTRFQRELLEETIEKKAAKKASA
jgi:hypothetical protein